MVDGAGQWRRGCEFPRYARRCLGHAGGHVHGVDRCHLRAHFPATTARSTTRAVTEQSRDKLVKIDKYISVFNIGLQNTFVYRWNYFLRALFGLIPLAGTVFLWRAVFNERGSGLHGWD